MRSRIWGWVGFAVLAFLVLFLLWPALRLTASSLTGAKFWSQFFSRPYYYRGLLNSLWLSVAATAGSVAIGVPLAVLLARYQIPFKGLIRAVAVLTLLSPPFIGAYAWVILLGRNGFLTKALGLAGFSIYGPGGVLLVFILHHFAYVMLLTATALSRIDPSLEEAAETLGVPPWKRLWTITLPLVIPSIAAGALLVFTATLADFGTPMLIGEGLRTLPVLAYNEFLSELGGSTGMATVTSVLMLLVALGALALQTAAVGKRNYAMTGLRRPTVAPLTGAVRWAGGLLALVVTLAAALPQLVVLVTSFMRARGPVFTGEYGLDNYRLVMDRMAAPVLRTLGYAGTATAIMLVLGLLVAYVLVRRPGSLAKGLDAMLILSQVLPGTVLGVGLIVSWGRPPLMLTGTGSILVIAYVVRRLAYTARAAGAGLKQISVSVEEASLTLGASPLRTFLRVTAPLVLPAALSGAVVSWVSTLSELSSTIMLYTGRTSTVSVLIYNQVLTDSFGTAAALGSVLTALTLGSLWLLQRFAGEQEGVI